MVGNRPSSLKEKREIAELVKESDAFVHGYGLSMGQEKGIKALPLLWKNEQMGV